MVRLCTAQRSITNRTRPRCRMDPHSEVQGRTQRQTDNSRKQPRASAHQRRSSIRRCLPACLGRHVARDELGGPLPPCRPPPRLRLRLSCIEVYTTTPNRHGIPAPGRDSNTVPEWCVWGGGKGGAPLAPPSRPPAFCLNRASARCFPPPGTAPRHTARANRRWRRRRPRRPRIASYTRTRPVWWGADASLSGQPTNHLPAYAYGTPSYTPLSPFNPQPPRIPPSLLAPRRRRATSRECVHFTSCLLLNAFPFFPSLVDFLTPSVCRRPFSPFSSALLAGELQS
jgi:hypothetical protein